MGGKLITRLSNEKQCEFCKCDFVAEGDETMCTDCTKHGYTTTTPKTNESQDVIQSDQKRLKEMKALIKTCIREYFEEQKQAKVDMLAPKICTVCEKEFTPRAPAQKLCDDCHDKKDAN
jgi:hypothetical protein